MYRAQYKNEFYSNFNFIHAGFLSTEDAEAPGNYGLLDQSLALRLYSTTKNCISLFPFIDEFQCLYTDGLETTFNTLEGILILLPFSAKAQGVRV